jgi:hypothetical protein
LVQAGLDKNVKPYLKNKEGIKGWGTVQVVERLHRKLEALSSKLSIAKKTKAHTHKISSV